jgi:hypothetical protein
MNPVIDKSKFAPRLHVLLARDAQAAVYGPAEPRTGSTTVTDTQSCAQPLRRCVAI